MENINLAIHSQSFVINTGFQFIFNKIRGIQVVCTDLDFADITNCLSEKQVDFILVSDQEFNQNPAIEILYKTNKHLRWGIIHTQAVKLNSMYNFELQLNINDNESAILQAINHFAEGQKHENDILHSNSDLSEREKEVLKQVALGLTNAEMAEKLFISQHTVITHRKKITAKLGIKTISGLTVYALLNNLIEMGDVDALK